MGRISRFDWSQTEKVSVLWYIFGCGNYTLQIENADPGLALPPNKAVDIYINKWVQIQPLVDPKIT